MNRVIGWSLGLIIGTATIGVAVWLPWFGLRPSARVERPPAIWTPTPSPMPDAVPPLGNEWQVPPLPFTLPDRAALGQPLQQPGGIIVPHHLPAGELMAQGYARVDPAAYHRVVLISPNHFAQGRGSVHLASIAVATQYGTVPAASSPPELDYLPTFTVAQLQREHGLYLHLPFVARYLPGVPVLMAAVRADATADELERAAGPLATAGTLAVLSFDFSHEQSPRWAAFHDQAAVAALQEADPETINHLEADVLPALGLFLRLMRVGGKQRFEPWRNENLGTLNPGGDYEQVTSYITGGYFPGPPAPTPGMSLTFTGDVILDRRVYAEAKRAGGLDYPFREIPRLLSGDDFTIIDLGGPMTMSPYRAPETQPNSVTYNFDPAYRPFLKAASIEVFGLANNHTRNLGGAGLEETRRQLEENGGLFVGDPATFAEPLELSRHGTNVTIFGIYDTTRVNYVMVAERLRQVAAGRFTVVLIHWGVEYARHFNQRQQQIARGLIEAGAGLIVGRGTHVIQPIEVYRGKAIFYSLGNFIFDQVWSAATQQGLVVGARVNDRMIDYYLQPVTLGNGQVRRAAATTTAATLTLLAETVIGSNKTAASIRNGQFSLTHE